jgi:formate dehydrogenase subunit beta
MPIDEPLTHQLRDRARQLLESGQVDCVIGYETSPRGNARPAFVYDPVDVVRLVWGDACVHNLVTYLHDKKKPLRRGEEPPHVGIVVKPCDSRALNVLLAERQIERERLFVIGVACEGVQIEGETPARCARCEDRVPVVYDVLLGEPPQVEPVTDGYADLAQVEDLAPAGRLALWLREFDRCIRCSATAPPVCSSGTTGCGWTWVSNSRRSTCSTWAGRFTWPGAA